MNHLQDVEVGEAKKHFRSKGLKPVPVQKEVLKNPRESQHDPDAVAVPVTRKDMIM
jgi:hypothetical protein